MSIGETYKHSQTGIVVVMGTGLAALGTILAVYAGSLPWLGLLLTAIFVLALILFASLTVSVDGASVTVRFGPGLIRKSFRLGDILAVRAARNPWYYGWGIRRMERGWLYNVSGLDAVEIELSTGEVHRIGTDEPQKLMAAIRNATGIGR
jgi:hypothetical protein